MPSRRLRKGVTDLQTHGRPDGRTDQRTNTPSYGDATVHLKTDPAKPKNVVLIKRKKVYAAVYVGLFMSLLYYVIILSYYFYLLVSNYPLITMRGLNFSFNSFHQSLLLRSIKKKHFCCSIKHTYLHRIKKNYVVSAARFV